MHSVPALHTARRTATAADSKRKTTAQALAELSATAQPRELQAVIHAVKSGFEQVGGEIADRDLVKLRGEIAELRDDLVQVRSQFYAFRGLQLRENEKNETSSVHHNERARNQT